MVAVAMPNNNKNKATSFVCSIPATISFLTFRSWFGRRSGQASSPGATAWCDPCWKAQPQVVYAFREQHVSVVWLALCFSSRTALAVFGGQTLAKKKPFRT